MKLSRISFLFLLVFLLVPSIASAQSAAEKSWKPFWTRFTKAVKTKNRAAIKTMAWKGFGGICANVSVSEWIKELDNGNGWSEVVRSVNLGTTVSSNGKERISNNYLIFHYTNGKWVFYCIMGD